MLVCEYEYIDQNIAIFDVLLPNTDDAKVQLFSTIESMANDTGHVSISLAVNVPDAKKTAKKTDENGDALKKNLSIKVSLIGSYNDLLYFLQKLENMQYFSNITSISIAKVSSDKVSRGQEVDAIDRTDLIKTDMTVNFYLENDNEEDNK